MRTASIILDGKEYPMCFSTRVVRACSERYGGVEHIGAALSGEDLMKVLDETLWLLATMLDAGARYVRLNGGEPLQPPNQEALYDLCDMEDLAGLKSRVMTGMAAGTSHTVEARPPKNGETAQGPVEIRDRPALSGTSGMA